VRAVASLVLQHLQDASGAFNSFEPPDDIGALERPKIPENDKVANVKSCTPFLFGMPTFGHPP